MLILLSPLFFACRSDAQKIDTATQIETESIDLDDDGVLADDDCDDNNPEASTMETYYQDNDGDGFGDDDTQAEHCGAPEGMVTQGGDCDDSNPQANDTSNDQDCDAIPTAEDCDDNNPERGLTADDMDCDGILNDTDTDADGDDVDAVDENGDAIDCDDTDPSLRRISEDMDCDGIPNDTDTNADGDDFPAEEDCNDMDPNLPLLDADCDGFLTEDDCDDSNPDINPGATDVLNDCDDSNDYEWGSCTLDGASHLSIADNEDWDLGSEDFTIEAYVYQDGTYDLWEGIVAQWPLHNYNLENSWTLESVNSELWFCYTDTAINDYMCPGGGTLTAFQWQHVAVTRSGNDLSIFIDGSIVHSAIITATIHNAESNLTIGGEVAAHTGYGNWSGHISNVRVIKGTALYTQDFTPSASPLTTTTDTTLLACQSTTTPTDALITPSTITNSGNVTATTDNPF